MKKEDNEDSTLSSEDPTSTPEVLESAAAAALETSPPILSEITTTQIDTPPEGEVATKDAEGTPSSCDKADELSRELEDIVNTYCNEMITEDATTLPNGQSHSPEPNGVTDERDDGKLDEGKLNEVEKGQKRERKRGKGLGKEVTLLMQTLSTLSTPEQKLTGLCKKYAELLEEHRTTQKQMRGVQKKQDLLLGEKDTLRSEHSKAILARSKLESLCRELQRHNRTLKDEGIHRSRLEEAKRREMSCHFQVTLNRIQSQMEQHECNISLRQENIELAKKLKNLYDQYKLRDEHINKVVKHKDLQQKLAEAKLQQAQELLKESVDQHDKEKDILLKEAVESQRMCELMKQQEGHLKQQLSLYTEKFEEFKTTLSKSNEVFTTFKQEMEKMTKKIKKLEKETAMYRSRWESSNKALLEMVEEKAVQDREFEALQGKVQRLEKLQQALKVERNKLKKKVQLLDLLLEFDETADSDSLSPPPAESPLEAIVSHQSPSVPQTPSCSHSAPSEQNPDSAPQLEGQSKPE
ncbi:alpha-taxilin [Synchiropus splendidus]|uniref:alpha-taxilin n=1 Tax=Synchiropus splendidus TaxID=270530 RepID=UPI00237E7B1D|nr:alpha-taxilin [Synchiropus splendidus]